jgi:hypothetical protein
MDTIEVYARELVPISVLLLLLLPPLLKLLHDTLF